MATCKKKHIKAVSQKVKLFRANEPLLSVFMWGINHTVNELSHVNIPVMLMPDDFKAYTKTKVDNHCFNKENLPSHFKVKEYCPLVFRNLREKFGINDTEYMNSMTSAEPVYNDSPGRSGARFLISADKKYVIKTISREEVEMMHNIIKQYHQFTVEHHGKTLLPHYLGMYRITVDGAETYLIVMRSVLSTTLNIHKKFDLKGSTVDRRASDKEKAKELPTFKDNDFVDKNHKIYIGKEGKEELLAQLKIDVVFLSELKLMDYSLLVGIHDIEKAEQEYQEEMEVESNGVGDSGDQDDDSGSNTAFTPPDSPQPASATMSTFQQQLPVLPGQFDSETDIFAIKSSPEAPRKEIYFMALIDILTHWGAKKRAAQAAKTVKHGAGAEISTVKPEQYSRRFMEFIGKVIE
ncbi:phosphatidylinositol 5-phosphate 4-kinase type-2 alpha-like [Saccoglossus kowalevskii]|uniref:Phosphatidylinositol 5-phosphate 4-kinase type-2 alpha-like n=1 Tax=Saccoglossus kowalevskii TaxID=10224 RepID=A0ABM0GLN5_SACKO|nr:PREDICTED: phosphatidylinositol 5-phosphate 4-kinase type-2 alpha-like [Saccoglossus kowalevskii]